MTTISVSAQTYDEIKAKLRAAGREVFDGRGLNMNGIVLIPLIPFPDLTDEERRDMLQDFGVTDSGEREK